MKKDYIYAYQNILMAKAVVDTLGAGIGRKLTHDEIKKVLVPMTPFLLEMEEKHEERMDKAMRCPEYVVSNGFEFKESK